MRKKAEKNGFGSFLGKLMPYVAVFLMILGVAKVGTDSKNAQASNNINMNTIAASDYNVSADQLTDLYVVASVSSSFDLVSVDTVAGNYVVASVMKETGQTSSDKIEKPSLINTNISRGVDTYVVKEGETMASIAWARGLTTDQIRWSNGLKTTDVNVGDTLRLPTVAGIVYTARAGDTPESLAEKYGSSVEGIIARNDLESKAITEGAQIVLPGGALPLKERPEYVPVYTYSYYGSTSDRRDMIVVRDNVVRSATNRMTPGQCTYYAWWWREANGNPLPAALTGDAKYWAVNARRLGMRVDNTPAAGAVFQTSSGWFGHVGVVLRVNDDGSLLVREMNYGYRAWTVTESIIPANIVGNFSFIH